MSTVDPGKYYGRCDSLDEQSRSYCREYIDQCVAQRATRGARDSTYELVSENGKSSTGLKFIDCIQLSPIHALHGKPRITISPADKEPLPKPDAKPQQGSNVVVRNCHASHFGPLDADPPAWIASNAPEHQKRCTENPIEEDLLRKVTDVEARVATLLHYCRSTSDATRDTDRDGSKTGYSQEVSGIRLGPWSGVTPYVERKGDQMCIHAFFNWSTMSCPDGRQYTCE